MELKSRSKLYDRLTKVIEKNAKNRPWAISILDACFRLYSIPQAIISNYIYGTENIQGISDELLQPVATVILGKEADDYFPKKLEKYKYKQKDLIKEIKPVFKIADDQWMGVIEINDLIDLYNTGKIRYNPETQRPMKLVVKGNSEIYRFYRNERAINEIADALSRDDFIPNTITINAIKDGFENDISGFYNEADSSFAITKIDRFDLLDGYHRFLALQKVALLNPGYRFKMELRITNFTLEKAHQFIFQEDQKTKMTKVQSASFNTADLGNQVVRSLKERRDLGAYISRNGGIIDEAFLGAAVGSIFFSSKIASNSGQLKAKQEAYARLYKGLTGLILEHPELVDQPWDRNFIACAVWCCRYCEGEDLYGRINKLYESKGDSGYFRDSTLKGYVVSTKELEQKWKAR